MTINELRARKAKAWDDCKNYLDAHRKDGILSSEDEAVYNKMLETVDNLDKEIARAEDAAERDAAMAAPTSSPIVSTPGKPESGRSSEEYKKAFNTYLKTRKASNAMQEDTNSEGGYLVPTEFERVLYQARDAADPIFKLAGKITLGAKEKQVPYVSSEGVATLIAEEGAYGLTDDAVGQVVFRAYKFGRIIKVSDELIADSAFPLSNYLAESLGRSIGKCEAGYFWTGTGSSQPQGVITAGTVAVTTASNSAITADEIIDLYYSVPEEYRENAVFVFNNATVAAIRKLKDSAGHYLWAPGGNGYPDTLLGKPLYTSGNIPVIAASAKVGVFGDIGACYKIADREGLEFKVLNELYAGNGQVGFRGMVRSDGKGILAGNIKVLQMHA